MPPEDEKGPVGRLADALTGRVLDTVDVDLILNHVDIDALLDRIDVNGLLDRIDVNRLILRVDVNALLSDVDINALLSDVDMDELLRNVDLEGIVRRSGIPAIVAESSGQMAGSALDVLRRQLAGLDAVVDRVVNSVLRRDPASLPLQPVKLVQGEQT